MRDHPAAVAIRRALDVPGLRTTEDSSSGTFGLSVADLDGRPVIAVTIQKAEGRLVVGLRDLGRRNPYTTNYWQPDRETGAPLDRDGRRQIDACRSALAALIARYRRDPEPEPPDAETLADRIRDLIASDPDGAAERIAEAVARATDAGTTAGISEDLARAPGYRE